MSTFRDILTRMDETENKSAEIIKIGQINIDHRLSNIQNAQARVAKAAKELVSAKEFLEQAQVDFATAVNSLDIGINVSANPLPSYEKLIEYSVKDQKKIEKK